MYRTPLKTTLIILILGSLHGLAAGCARFRIEELKPGLILSLPIVPGKNKNPEGNLHAMESGRVIYNLPPIPALDDDRAILIDPARQKVRIFSLQSGEVRFILENTSENKGGESGYQRYNVDVGVPGIVVSNQEGDIYVQSRPYTNTDKAVQIEEVTPPENRLPGRLNPESMTMKASRILQINEDGQLLRTIGVEGIEGAPFKNIIRMYLPANDLFVLHNEGEYPVLTKYTGGDPTGEFSIPPASLSGEGRSLETIIEDIIPLPDGESAIASVGFRVKKDYNLAYRKIYRLGSDGSAKELLKNDEAGDYFAWIKENGGFYLMNSYEDGSGILFKIYSPEGEYLNNRLILFPGVRGSWMETFLTFDNRILSTRINRGRYEIYEWK